MIRLAVVLALLAALVEGRCAGRVILNRSPDGGWETTNDGGTATEEK